MSTPKYTTAYASVFIHADADTDAPCTCARLLPRLRVVGLRPGLQKPREEAPASLWPLAQKCGEPLKLPQLRWKPLRAALRGSHSFSNKRENSSAPWCFY